MVQKGKFSAGTVNLVSALNIVDFPELGSPTIPRDNECDLFTDIMVNYILILRFWIPDYQGALYLF